MSPIMALFNFAILLLLLPLHVCGASKPVTEGKAYVTGSVELKCNFSKPKRLDKSNMAYQWQKQNPENKKEEVFYELERGETIKKHLDPKYLNRNMTLLPNWDLLIHDITLRDTGTYKCLVFNRTSWRDKIHVSDFKLHVIVNVTYPEIIVISKSTEKFGSTFELECYSKMCYPDPEGVIWNIHNSSGTFNVEGNSTVLADEYTEIFNVSSIINLYVEVNTTVSCMIQTNHTLKSTGLEIQTRPLPPDNWDYSLCILIAIGVFVFILFAVGIGIYWKSRCVPQTSPEPNQINGVVAELPLNATVRIDPNRLAEETDRLNEIGNPS